MKKSISLTFFIVILCHLAVAQETNYRLVESGTNEFQNDKILTSERSFYSYDEGNNLIEKKLKDHLKLFGGTKRSIIIRITCLLIVSSLYPLSISW